MMMMMMMMLAPQLRHDALCGHVDIVQSNNNNKNVLVP
jgi:hypothetical protein